MGGDQLLGILAKMHKVATLVKITTRNTYFQNIEISHLGFLLSLLSN